MIKEKAQHFGTRVRTGGGGVTASCIATCPRVWRAMNGPQLCIDMRSILLYLLGVPIPIIILIALFWH